MKKAFTLIAMLAMLATVSFAQNNARRLTDKDRAGMSPVAMFMASQHATAPMATAITSAPKNVITYPWTEDFESGTATGFTFIDADGDNYGWEISNFETNGVGHNGSDYTATSASYVNYVGAVTPDNWMILPAFDLPTSATDFELSWFEKAQDSNWSEEFYSVYINTTGAAVTNFTATTAVLTSTTTGRWVRKVVDLSAYAGQTIYIAFRHHNCTDMFYLDIDDIYVGSPLPPDLYISGPAITQLNQPVTYTATTSVQSVDWYVDGTQETTTGLTLTYTFTTDGIHEVVAAASNNAGTVYDTMNVNVIDCGAAIDDFPYTEGFEAWNPCWNFVSADPANDAFAGISSDEQHAGNSSFALSSYAEADDYNQYFITPEFNLTAGTDYMVSFWYKGDHAADAFRVKVSSTTNDTAAFTTVLADYPTVNTEWTLVALQLPANTKYIAFNYYGDYQYYLYIDEFSVDEMGVPTVSVNGDTYIGTGMEATYVATANLADTVEWLVDGESVAANGDTMTYMFTTAGMHEVVAMASNTYGSAYDTISVEVFSCDDITIPYTPDFTMGLGCWSNRSDLEEGYGWHASVNAFDSDPEGQVISMSAINYYGMAMVDVDVDNWLTSPVITMPENGNYEIAWSVKPFSTTYAGDHYGVYLIQGTDTTLLFEETLNSSMTDFAERAAAIPSTTNGDFQIAFRHFNNAGGYVIIIDDIEVRNLSTPNVTISGPTTAEKDIEVVYTANSGNAETYSWSIDGTEVSGVTGNTLTYTFTTAGNHTVAVTATNAVGTSDAATLTVMVIACDHIANFPYSEDFEGEINCWKFYDADGDSYTWDYSLSGEGQGHNESDGLIASASYINNIGALTPDNWMVMPAVDVPAGSNLYLNWFAKGQDEEYYEEYYSVYISTTGYNVNDFTNAVFSETTTNEWAGHHVSLANYAGQTIYIAFRHHNVTDMFYLDIDDISISETAVGINNVNDINVNIYPNPVSSVLNIEGEGIEQVEVMDLNGRIILTSAATSLNIENLASGVYMVRVIAAEGTRVEKIVKK